ncbi:GPW/gp25 family protein [Paenibacillus tyrfis]|uniref:IraD/Gp25-like domain-containing protein n=1 Tax=Paenibacillus tyrfis TaxID=1501230 RepID=A0A081NV28_9BACL|nr:GPW/gp25 family protein [Paenibacillus tyrfis]KEQ22301.1 hypothetical protein ET33_26370 [Paenibacillus tyrfis]
MEYTVSTQSTGVIFGATGLQAIIQNVRTILTTVQGTVPLDRGFGIDIVDIDTPIEVARALLSGRIIDAVRKYEPRVEVVSVNFLAEEGEGRLLPVVKIRLREGGTV